MAADVPPPVRALPTLRAPRWAQGLLAFTFFAALAWFCAMTFLGRGVHRTVSLSEKRALAPVPARPRDAESLAAFPQACEAWINDHFMRRDWLVGAYSLIQMRLFDRSARLDITIGKHGWLYYNIGGTLDDYRGMLRFTPEQLDYMHRYLAIRAGWFERHHMAYVFVVGPDKHTIYPENLPAYLRRKRREGTELDQFLADMSHGTQAGPPVGVIDLRPALLQAKQTDLLYLLTDTHWNEAGGRTGARVIREWMQQQHPAQPLPPPTGGAPEMQEKDGGDLAAALGLARVLLERSPHWTLSPAVTHAPWQQPGLEDWWPAATLFTRQDEASNLRALFFGDSYSDAMKYSLSEACGEALFLPRTPTMHHTSFEHMRALVNEFHPDVVVEEVVERNLANYFFGDPDIATESVHYVQDQ